VRGLKRPARGIHMDPDFNYPCVRYDVGPTVMGNKGLSKLLVDEVRSQKCIGSQKARAILAFRFLKTIIEKCE
jgi:hypothetical protein